MDRDERAAWIRLAVTPGLGPAAARALLTHFGLPTDVLAAGLPALLRHVPEAVARALAAGPDEATRTHIEATEAWLAADPDHALLSLADAEYPHSLLSITDPPLLLYCIGRRGLLAQPSLAIVGSRSASRQGAQTAESFAHSLARAGLTIVSGLALGIDAAAHEGALRAHAAGAAASSIAVVGTGIDIVYPTANRALTERLRRDGLVLSEFPLGTPALAHNFPRRNRLIAALARGVLVVEAALRSGSLITARLAAEQGREVFAIPGSIHSPMARGCHRLIRDGAKLVESASDVLEELRIDAPCAGADSAAAGNGTAADDPALTAGQRAVLDALGHDPLALDTLAQRCAQDAGPLAAVLMELELAQYVERLPGNRYQRLR